jgi:hypothetical protein
MTTSALILMLTYCIGVTVITGYFFYLVLTTERRKTNKKVDQSIEESEKTNS